MKTLDEHNQEFQRKINEALINAKRAGVTCPKCGEQLVYSDEGGGELLTGSRLVHCVTKDCGFKGSKRVKLPLPLC